MELCSGTASVSNEIRKQGHVVGNNFDVAADQQYDLRATSGRRLLRRTLLEEHPAVVVASPPCAYLAGCSKLNAKQSPETFAERRAETMQFAGQVARVCNDQLHATRWFLVENPQRSHLWTIPEIATLIQGISAATDA
eukprot:2364836-Amphidinium_carterae.2